MKKTPFKIGMIIAILSIALVSCDTGNNSDNGEDGGGKLSPPSWAHGKWGEGNVVAYHITSTNVYVGDNTIVSLTGMFQNTPFHTYTFDESKSDLLYEITVSVKVAQVVSAGEVFSFKRGDGTFIDFGTADEGKTVTSYKRLLKIEN
jgi:hypothetical protein